MADFAELEHVAGQLLAGLEPGERRRLTRQIAVDLRRANAQRIAAQRNPDGSGFEPRKSALQAKKGRIKRKAKAGSMFRKIRSARHLRADSTPSEASVGFAAAAVSRIARVHQLGLRDRVSRRRGAPEVQYPRRELLGFTAEDPARILDLIVARLSV